ncbi:MAG: cobalamin B12-binding domain-containing protein [Ilumatobacteraceae bacterium]|uniref:cobalamin B12-binding domain-containing protein n=1 Tax=Ilumatobacter fluminis TaxID=467091 RepID=UPI00296853ED|nr:cobalamin B12-binding domain-containing protein [Ilumatobacteraceae bacterium]
MTVRHPPRVLVAKPGLDGHDRGAKVIALALRDRGCEVVYLGMRCTAERIAGAAAQEDVDVIGISILSGAHLRLTDELMTACRDHGVDDIPIVVGGIVPPRDIDRLLELGVAAVFPAGSDLNEVTDTVVALAAGAEVAR